MVAVIGRFALIGEREQHDQVNSGLLQVLAALAMMG
jgi:hypothetical protein